ncbi:MAG: DUF1926 domain-containing protein [Spirochaetia bacterium]|nr:DUF1926 domain-containing protein [Spirochaetia bacterium]
MICGVYSQIAPGTPTFILENLLSEVYKPVLTYMYQHPHKQIHLFLSGTVFEWFELYHPEINMLIADLVKKDQIELITGAFYQPLLSLLHPKDRSSHIEATTTFIRKRFGKRPKSMWLFNQMWSPNFVSTMQVCSVDRLLISTYNSNTEQTYQEEPFVMQDIGKTIEVFPINHTVEQAIDLLRSNKITLDELEQSLQQLDFSHNEKVDVVMINLDHMYQASNSNTLKPSPLSIFEKIFAIIENGNKQTKLLSAFPTSLSNLKKGYLLTGWYGNDSHHQGMSCVNEMLIEHNELLHLYGRLVYVSELARLYKKNKDVRKRVETLIMKSQSGGPFVLDSSGGCYRSEYRQYIYKHLNEAEKLIAQYEGITYPREVDIDFDGYNEVILKSRNLLGVINRKGGVLSELNYLVTGWNYGDTFSGSSKEITRHNLRYLEDGVPQRLFNDVLLPHSFEDFTQYDKTKAYDTSSHYWTLEVDDKGEEVSTSLDLEHVPFSIGSVEIKKVYQLKSSSVVIQYTLTNRGPRQSKGIFATEMNISLGQQPVQRQLYTVEKSKNRVLNEDHKIFPNLNNFRISDEYNKTMLSIASDIRFSLYKDESIVDLETMMGKESLYQYSLFLLSCPFDLKSGEFKTWTIGWRIERRTVRQHKKELA